MPDVLVVESSSHPIETETFRDALGSEYAVSNLELPPGSLHVRADDELTAALDGVDAVFTRAGALTESVLDATTHLQVIAVHGSGYDHIDVDAATANDIVVTHNPEGPGPAVVEHTIAQMILLLREFPARFAQTAEGEWSRDPVRELSEQTVGVVGLGYIGSRVAEIASETFGADVIGYDPYVDGTRDSDIWPRVDRQEVEAAGVELVDEDDLFSRADVVTLHTPLTDRTADLVSDGELAALEGGYLVNTARGGVVDEDALLTAVESGTIAGAALDVLNEEPPEATDPLLDHPRIHVTPHIASATAAYPRRAAEAAAEKIQMVLSGERPATVVNPAV